jgi:thermostable 8-oxoguanine DNA glycosylase
MLKEKVKITKPQIVYRQSANGDWEEKMFPGEGEEIISGVFWGKARRLMTPAYWAAQAWMRETMLEDSHPYRLGDSLKEEVVACLLGGHGIRYEMAQAAFDLLKENGIMERAASEEEIFKLLSKPLPGLDGKRYRFPRVKSRYLHLALTQVHEKGIPQDATPVEIRDWFLEFKGIGLKTASWIVRNRFGSNSVAILDIHVCRACRYMGLFSQKSSLSRDYLALEELFLNFSKAIGVEARYLDLLIWEQMRKYGHLIKPASPLALGC